MQTLDDKIRRGSHENLYSSDDDNISDEDAPPSMQGKLFKWTNMLHGWQERFFHLRDGVLSYYKSRDDVNLGCRGSIRLQNAYVRPHEADDCRFEIRVGDSIWYLRGSTIQERKRWIESIELHRISESGYGSEQNLRRQNSWHSLNSATSLSIASASSFKRSHRLKEKLAEMETFKEILNRQVESLQNYFDTCSAIVRDSAHDNLERYLLYDESTHCGDSNGYYYDDDDDDDGEENGFSVTTTAKINKNTNNLSSKLSQNNPMQHHHHHHPHQNHSMISTSNADGASLSSESVTSSDHSGLLITAVGVPPTPPLPSVVINNGQIESANNGTIFEDARETLPETNASPEPTNQNDKPSTPTKYNPPATQQRGFLSKFFPFRSSTSPSTSPSNPNSTTTVVTNSNITAFSNTTTLTPTQTSESLDYPNDTSNQASTLYSEDQYEPSSRFEDLKKIIKQHGGHAVDFKGESYTFKATTTGILTNLCYCIEIMQQREDSWRRRLDREIDRRRRSDESQRNLLIEIAQLQSQLSEWKISSAGHSPTAHSQPASTGTSSSNGPMKLSGPYSTVTTNGTTSHSHNNTSNNKNKLLIVGSPDLQEGPTCTIGEEEFFDAVDAQLDQMELDDERKAALQRQESKYYTNEDNQFLRSDHELYEEVENVVMRHLVYCDPTARELRPEDGWILQAEEGEMRIYNKEVENDNGVVLDPLHIVHEVQGVTAREFCNYFWDVRYRMDWEIAIDQPPTIIEYCSGNTILLHQVYKRVWPTTQRDSVYWSHIRQINKQHLLDAGLSLDNNDANNDMWLVMNYSTDHKAPQEEPNSQMIRLMLDVVLICQTVISPNAESGLENVSRDQITCRILYASCINPGGWAPASVLRTVARREYPRFIKRFSQYVQLKTANLSPELK